MITGLIIGLFIGVALGVLIMSLMAISKRAGKRSQNRRLVASFRDLRRTFYEVDQEPAEVAIRRLRDAD